MKRTSIGLALLASAVASGCGTTTRSAKVGEMLSGGGVHVTVERVDLHPPIPSDDVTGLGTPAAGHRLIAARVRICSNVGPAIGTWDFGLSLSDGSSALIKFPQENYADGFDSVRTGCERGWVVFELPASSRPTKIRFAFDDSGSGSGTVAGRPETHERFSWAIS